MSDGPGDIIDWTLFARTRSELGVAFVKIIGYFREDSVTAVGRIEEAMQRKQTSALVSPAHTLKTEARQFGGEALGRLAEEIEFAARRAIEMRVFPDELIPTVARLRPLLQQTLTALDREISPLAQRRPGFGRAGAANQEFGRI